MKDRSVSCEFSCAPYSNVENIRIVFPQECMLVSDVCVHARNQSKEWPLHYNWTSGVAISKKAILISDARKCEINYALDECAESIHIHLEHTWIDTRIASLLENDITSLVNQANQAAALKESFLGFRTEALTRQQLQDQGVELIRYTNLYQDGYPLSYMFQLYDGMFLSYTLKSYVGVFGYMNIFLPEIMYGLYLGMILMGILVYAAVSFTYKKNPLQRNIMWMMLGASIITIALHIAHSYFRDFQAQGRYILTTAVFLAWMIAYGFDHVEVRSHGAEAANRCSISAALFTNGMLLIWIVLFVCALTNTMSQMF